MADEGDDTQVHLAAHRRCMSVCVPCMPPARSPTVLLRHSAAAVAVQYQHIREERDLAPPTVDWLRSLAGVRHGSPEVQPDWFSALTVRRCRHNLRSTPHVPGASSSAALSPEFRPFCQADCTIM